MKVSLVTEFFKARPGDLLVTPEGEFRRCPRCKMVLRVDPADIDIETVSLRQLTCKVTLDDEDMSVCNATYRITDGELEIVE